MNTTIATTTNTASETGRGRFRVVRGAAMLATVALTTIGSLAVSGAAEARIKEPALDSHAIGCKYLQDEVDDLIAEYAAAAKAGTLTYEQSEAIIAEAQRLVNQWNQIGCRARFGNIHYRADVVGGGSMTPGSPGGIEENGMSDGTDSSLPIDVATPGGSATYRVPSSSRNEWAGPQVAAPATGSTFEPGIKAEVDTDLQPEIKAEVDTNLQPEIKAEVDTDLQPEIKAEADTDLQPEIKAEVDTNLQPEIKAEVDTDLRSFLGSRGVVTSD